MDCDKVSIGLLPPEATSPKDYKEKVCQIRQPVFVIF